MPSRLFAWQSQPAQQGMGWPGAPNPLPRAEEAPPPPPGGPGAQASPKLYACPAHGSHLKLYACPAHGPHPKLYCSLAISPASYPAAHGPHLKLYCVLAMHTGRPPRPMAVYNWMDAIASSEYSTPAAPYIRRAIVSIFSYTGERAAAARRVYLYAGGTFARPEASGALAQLATAAPGEEEGPRGADTRGRWLPMGPPHEVPPQEGMRVDARAQAVAQIADLPCR